AEEGRVESIDVRDDVVEATVVGSEAYDVVWEHDRGEWRASCSCPVGSFCKHAYAVARCLVADSTLGRPAARRPAAAKGVLDLLLRAREPWERQQALSRVLPRGWLHSPQTWTFHELLDEPDPDVFCWRVAQALAARGPLPRELEPFRDRPDLSARLEERRRAALLVWLTDHGLGGNEPWLAADPGRSAALPALIERIAGSPLGAWSETLPSDLAGLGGVAPGDLVRLSPEAARLAPLCFSRNGDT